MHPHLNDAMMFMVDNHANTVWIKGYSSNECSILQTFPVKKYNNCSIAHFWCLKLCAEGNDVISYEGEGTFDYSISTCIGMES